MSDLKVRWMVTGFILAAMGVATSPLHAQAFSEHAPTFTVEQANRGKQAYAANNCTVCHGETLGGTGVGPALVGAAFAALWHGLQPSSMYAFMTAQMPPTAPGQLSVETYRDLSAYIFQANGFAPGGVAFNATNINGGAESLPPQLRIHHDARYDAAIARRQATLNKISPVSDEMLRHPDGTDWLMWRGDYQGLGYSPLKQIDRNNVGQLTVAWARSLPISSNETTPLVHDGVVFLKSGNHVQAIDGATGELLWQYVRRYPEWMRDGTTEIVKNLAIYQDKLFVPFMDGHFVALNTRTGQVAWDHVLVGPEQAASRLPGRRDSPDPQHFLMVADGGPLVAKGEVIIGVAGCSNDYKGGCFIVGLDANTGKQDWKFNTIARPGQPGGDSWNGAPVDQRFGASIWTSGSYDPDLDLVYFGVGQTYKISTLLTPQAGKGKSNDALYTDSTIALKPKSGKLAWYYQHFNGDVWDLDWAFEQTLVTVPVDGKPRNLVVTGGKIAIFDALDRSNGKYVFSKNLDLQNIVSAIDPVTGHKTVDPSFLPQGKELRFTKTICPYARDQPATAFDPQNNMLYVPILNASCPDLDHKFDGQFGRVEAVNLATRQVAWIQPHRTSEAASLLVTAGGLVVDSTMDRVLRASDSMTGKVLWQTTLDNVAKSTPVTYRIGGRQYIAVVAGGALQNQANPASEFDTPSNAETLWIFALPQSRP